MLSCFLLFFVRHVTCLSADEKSAACGFDCWLSNLVINVPPVSTEFEATVIFTYKFNISLPDLVITGISLEALDTQFYPNKSKIEDGILFDVKISAQMSSDIIIEDLTGFLGTISGSFAANATGVDIILGLQLEKGPDGLIQSVSVYDDDKCSVIIDDLQIDIEVDSSWFLDELLQIFKTMITGAIKERVGVMTCSALEPLIREYGTIFFDRMNNFVRPFIEGAKHVSIPIDDVAMADLRKSSVVDLLRFVLTNLTNGDGPLNLNSLVNRFTNDTGLFDYDVIAKALGLPVPLSVDIPIDGLNTTIKLLLDDLVLTGLNTWSDFSFFEPISPFVLDTHTGLDNLGINVSFTVNVSSNGIISTGDTDLTESAVLFMQMDSNKLDLQFQLASPKGTADDYTNSMCYDLPCLLHLMSPNGTGVTIVQLDTMINLINLEAANGTIQEDIQNLINLIFDLLIDNYKEMIPPLLNGLINKYGTTYVNEKINETLTNNTCNYIEDPPYADWDPTFTAISFSQVVTIMIILIAVLCLVKRQKLKRREIVMNSTSVDNIVEGSSMTNMPLLEKDGKWLMFWRTDNYASLLMHPRLPLWVRILVPALILVNIALFLSSNSGLGASVFIKATIGEDRYLELPTMFDFGLINSIRDMWKAKTYALSILIAVMSCIWPYTKLILMLVVWIIPSNILRKSIRAKILRLLDELGKWSLLDSFVMILMLVAFHFALDFPIINTEYIKEPTVLYIWVYAAYGFVTLMLGTVVSLALSHLICALDRYADNRNNEGSQVTSNSRSSVFKSQKVWVRILISIFLVASFVLFIFGITQTSFSFQFVGLAGWALNLLDTPNQAKYTVLDLGFKLHKAAEHPNTFGIRFTQVLYFVVAVAVPMVHIVFISVMFFVPMTKKALHSIYVTCETLYAWSCLEVFIISLLATIVEIAQFTQFMVGDRCDFINPIISEFFKDEQFISGHEKCFEVVTILEKGAFFLVSAAFVHTITTLWIHSVSRKVLREEETSAITDITRISENSDILETNYMAN